MEVRSLQDKYVVLKYLRLSIEDGDNAESDSISNQRELLDLHISVVFKDVRNLEVIELVDDGYTGTNMNRPAMRESYLVSCIHLILCQIFESAAEIDVVSSIKNYIDANYMYNIKISDIAKDVNLDRKYLARIYKLKTGYTMKKHIIKNEWKRQRIFWVMDIMLTKLLS